MLALVQKDIPRCKQRLKEHYEAMPSVEPDNDKFVILPFIAWLAEPVQEKRDAVVTAIEEWQGDIVDSWDFSYFEPAIDHLQDESTKQHARAFIAFFKGEIKLKELEKRLENDRD